VIVFQTEDNLNEESLLVIVIEADNLDRMKKSDPITLKSEQMGGILKTVGHAARFRVLVAYEQDSGPLYEFLQKQDQGGLMQYLLRGYKLASNDVIPHKLGDA
jgi:hypothetical protein